MRKFFYLLLLPLVSFGLTTTNAAEPSNVRISFVQPEKFSDFQIQGQQETVSAGIFREQVSAFLSPDVASRFPGDTLALRFTNIDLAGRIDPIRSQKAPYVRVDRNIASPLRLYFDYTLTDSRGRILASGSKSLVDSDYLYRYTYYPNNTKSETLFYEKATLYRWVDTLSPSEIKQTAAK